MKNIARYARTAQLDINTAFQVQGQLAACHTLIDSGEVCEVVDYVDEGYSGATFARPALQRLLNDAKVGDISVVITANLSRLADRNDVLTKLCDKLATFEVTVIAVWEHEFQMQMLLRR